MKITEREYSVRMAAINAAYGAPSDPPLSHGPTDAELLYLDARECFLAGRPCRGWDLVSQADALTCYS